MRFIQTESVLQTKNRSGPAKNRFSVALLLKHLSRQLCKQTIFKAWPNSLQRGTVSYWLNSVQKHSN